jgi:hypothetical protein
MRAWFGPRSGLNAVADKKIPASAGNLSTSIHPLASHFADSSISALKFKLKDIFFNYTTLLLFKI